MTQDACRWIELTVDLHHSRTLRLVCPYREMRGDFGDLLQPEGKDEFLAKEGGSGDMPIEQMSS
jgi:hypothetical protein